VLFFDDEDVVLRDGSGGTAVEVIAGVNDEPAYSHRNYSPFHIIVQDHETAWSWYSVTITAASVPPDDMDLVRNLNPQNTVESFSNGYSLTGEISNDSGHPYGGVTVTVALYYEGVVQRVATVATNPSAIADNEEGAFSISIPDEPGLQMSSEIFVDGHATD
jgi:hypothetical protein